jgi:hypothetical protein
MLALFGSCLTHYLLIFNSPFDRSQTIDLHTFASGYILYILRVGYLAIECTTVKKAGYMEVSNARWIPRVYN